MNIVRITAGSVLALLGAGVAEAKGYRIDLTASSGQESRFVDGREVVNERSAGSAALVAENLDAQSKRGELTVYIANNGTAPFNFGPESVTIRLADGSSVAMLTYEDLLREQKRREGWQRFGAALGTMGRSMQASEAGNTYGSATYSGQTYGTYGSTPYSASTYGTGTYSGYNGAAAFAAQQQADQQNRADIERLNAQQAAARGQIGGYLKTTTIDPGKMFGGSLQFKTPQAFTRGKGPLPVTIEIRTGTETHTFTASIIR